MKFKQAASWDWETKSKKLGHAKIVGIDEVGRGAWAGPIVAAAYAFYTFPCEVEVFDSKVLTFNERDTLHETLLLLGVFGVGEATPYEIDKLGLQQAQYLAYRRALDRLPIVPDIVLLDGRPWLSCPFKHEAIVNGDALVASISAASIMAKHYRDNLMQSIFHARYPEYGFNTHVGYGTKSHQEAIKQHGVLDIHRQSYKPIKALVENSPKNTL